MHAVFASAFLRMQPLHTRERSCVGSVEFCVVSNGLVDRERSARAVLNHPATQYRKSEANMKRILVATDGSEVAKAAEQRGAKLAEKLGEMLTLSYVVEPPMVPPEGAFPLTEILDDHEAWAKNYLKDRARELNKPGLEVNTYVTIGSPAESIAKQAEDPSVDMVIVGSRGHNAVLRLVLGSVATRLGHICPKPLLIVRGEPTVEKKS